MGPKKGRPRKNSTIDNPDNAVDGSTAVPVVKSTRGRPAKKKTVLPPSTSTSDSSLPNIDNCLAEKRTTRGRGRKRAQLPKDPLSDPASSLKSPFDDNRETAVLPPGNEGSQKSEFTLLYQNSTFASDEKKFPETQISDSIERFQITKCPLVSTGIETFNTEGKANKENSSLMTGDNKSTSSTNINLPLSDSKTSKGFINLPETTIPFTTISEECLPVQQPFSPGDVPLKKRRLRDNVVRDQEGFVAPIIVNSLVSTAVSPPLCKVADLPEKPKRIIGAHVLYLGGLEQAIYRAKSCEYRALGMFIKDLKTWVDTNVITDEDVNLFQKAIKECDMDISTVIPRGSFIISICSSDLLVLEASIKCIVDDISRCFLLGLSSYVIQLDSHNSTDSREICIARVAKSLNSIHKQTSQVVTVLENSCGQPNTVGGNVTDFKDIFDLIEDKSRIGFALDTCHAYSSGIDLKKKDVYEELIQEFQEKIGLKYLKVVYLNDSGGDLGSHVDCHASIGKGMLGLECFERIIKDSRLQNVPLIIETPIKNHKQDFQTMISLAN